jgi:hypothetical protein
VIKGYFGFENEFIKALMRFLCIFM